jgi:ATP-dependent exoDNAse (exonuclease V) beta subunit
MPNIFEQPDTNNAFNVLRKLKQQDLFFSPAGHRYTYKGSTVRLSVTKFVSFYKAEFDKEFFLVKKATEQGVTTRQLEEEWKYLADVGMARGTIVHNAIESYLQNKLAAWEVPAVVRKYDREQFLKNTHKIISQGYKFIKEHYFEGNLTNICSEYPVGLISEGKCILAGMIDNVSITDDGRIVLIDYKTDKRFHSSSRFDKYMSAPFEMLEDCELSKYSLQLGIYKILFEQQTGLTVDKCVIVWLNEANEDYTIVETQKIENLTYELLRDNIKILNTPEQRGGISI